MLGLNINLPFPLPYKCRHKNIKHPDAGCFHLVNVFLPIPDQDRPHPFGYFHPQILHQPDDIQIDSTVAVALPVTGFSTAGLVGIPFSDTALPDQLLRYVSCMAAIPADHAHNLIFRNGQTAAFICICVSLLLQIRLFSGTFCGVLCVMFCGVLSNLLSLNLFSVIRSGIFILKTDSRIGFHQKQDKTLQTIRRHLPGNLFIRIDGSDQNNRFLRIKRRKNTGIINRNPFTGCIHCFRQIVPQTKSLQTDIAVDRSTEFYLITVFFYKVTGGISQSIEIDISSGRLVPECGPCLFPVKLII